MGSWSEHFTKDGRPYYHNRVTKQSRWEKPKNFETENTSPVDDINMDSDPKSLNFEYEWEELWDPKTERLYYHNRKKKKSQWEKPKGVDFKACTNYTKSIKKMSETQKNGSLTAEKNREADLIEEGTMNNYQSKDVERMKSKEQIKRKKSIKGIESKKKTRMNDEKLLIICDEKEKIGNLIASPLEQKDSEAGLEATHLLQRLSKPDAIMDSSLMLTINAFLRTYKDSNGPEVLVEKLSSSYRGHAQMIGLVATWLDWLMMETNAQDSLSTANSNQTSQREAEEPTWMDTENVLYIRLEDLIMQNYNPKMVRKITNPSLATKLNSVRTSRFPMC